MIITLISMASETVVYCSISLCNKYLRFYVYFSDTEASQACFRLLHDDDDDEVKKFGGGEERGWTEPQSLARVKISGRSTPGAAPRNF